jgi:DNA-binding beta-propeller fold protein YncE
VTSPTFNPVDGWGGGLPEMRDRDIPDVAAFDDEIFLAYRDPASIVVCGTDGGLRRIVGLGIIDRPHGVTVDARRIYVVDESLHRIHIFERSGEWVTSFGSGPSDPNFPATGLHPDKITGPRSPFTRPTRLATGLDGDLYVSDGYGNCRIHRFSAEGEQLRLSWGEPGTDPGGFAIPHSVNVDSQGRVLVCDRENDRIQVFDADGGFVEIWPHLHRPQAIAETADGTFYVAEGAWEAGRVSPTLGSVDPALSRVSVLSSNGLSLATIGDAPSFFVSAHGIAVDSDGDLYVVECLASLRANSGVAGSGAPSVVPPGRPAVQKLSRG